MQPIGKKELASAKNWTNLSIKVNSYYPCYNALMNHYIQYHNPDRWPSAKYAKTLQHELVVGTNKRVRDLLGSTVWLIRGEARPRSYFLCKRFVVDEVVVLGDDEAFRFLVRGSQGVIIEPPILLNNLPWFVPFLRSQSNFSFGLNRIAPFFLEELLQLCKDALK